MPAVLLSLDVMDERFRGDQARRRMRVPIHMFHLL